MSDDRGDLFSEDSPETTLRGAQAIEGFDQQDKGMPRRQIGGRGPTAQDQQAPPMDDLDKLLLREDTHPVTRLIAERLREVEKHFPDAFQIGQSIVSVVGRVQEMERVVTHLSQQRAVAEMGLERHTRATALDMAIKAVPEANKGDASLISALADGFLTWLKAGVQG